MQLRTPLRVLFVGNSLISYNDLPAKFVALRADSSQRGTAHAEMLAANGAGLRDRIRDGSLAREPAAQRYDLVVLQDFGSWPLCSTRIPACEEGSGSLHQAAALVRRHGAQPLWFATWMTVPRLQPELSAAGAKVAAEVGVDFIDVGAAMHEAAPTVPGLLHADGHPTPKGSWLAAMLLLQRLQPGIRPARAAVAACGRQWQGSDLRGDLLASAQPPRAHHCDRLDPATRQILQGVLHHRIPARSPPPVATGEKSRA